MSQLASFFSNIPTFGPDEWRKLQTMDFEITVRGLFTTVFALLATIIPILVYYFETRTPTVPAPASASELPLPPPTKIVGLNIYPIKSCRGIPLQKSTLLKTGLEMDRKWMFVDAATNKFLTIRQIAKMTLITPTFDAAADELVITVRSSPEEPNPPDVTIRVPAHPSEKWLRAHTDLVPTVIWKSTTPGWAYPATLTAPLTALLGRAVRLVQKGPEKRVLLGNGDPRILGREEATQYADMMPVLVASAASLRDLNARLRAGGSELALTMERFRPNIVVEGGAPWEEDVWSMVRIGGEGERRGKGEIAMQVVCRCLRCRVPNVDPETAEAHPQQPWDAMMAFRRIDEGMTYKPAFGMHCVPMAEPTEIRVGMEFEVTEVTKQHKYIAAT